MKHRVLGAPKNLTRRFEARYRAQRQGQALLLAVVVMLFVALISAGFLATVAGNLNQTARTSEKNRSVEAAKAGMTYINNRINSSAQGENWRPYMETEIPAIGAANYNNYYTPVAQIQKVVADATRPELSYGRFPDPKAPTTGDAPQFYAKVERIGYSLAERQAKDQATATSDPEVSRAGMLKISIFGLGQDDPNVFHRMVAYRGGYQAAPVGRVMRSVSGYDFNNKVVPTAQVDNAASTVSVLELKDNKGDFPTANFPIVISAPDGSNIRQAVVSSRTGTTLTLAAALGAIPTDGDHIDLAANIGAPTNLDYDRDGTASDAIALTTADNTAPASVRVNGSAWLQGDVSMTGLTSPSSAFADNNALTIPKTIQTSSLLLIDGAAIKSNDTAGATTNVVSSSATDFPFVEAASSPAAKDALISDGLSRQVGDLSPTRQTKEFTPPDLTSNENLERYRGLTRDSKPSIASGEAIVAGSSSFGYGQGIYIDNRNDREKVYDAGVLREMTQSELMDMWLSPTTSTASYNRLGTPQPSIPTNLTDLTTFNSLEEQHLRGWIAPDEFRARGVLIELSNNGTGQPQITITRDARDDNRLGATTNAQGGVISKGWKDTSGASQDGVYRKVFTVDNINVFNGVIFAEGNVRIKGTATGLQSSLTVVSLGNIYVEGSIGLDANRKILLAARRNVVVNPTSVISRVEGFTQVTTSPSAGVTLEVSDAGQFQSGDWIRIGAASTPYRIASVNLIATPDVITLDATTPISAAAATLITTGNVVKAAGDVIDPTTTLPYNDYARLAKYDGVLQRRIPTKSLTTARLALRHGAEKRKVASIEINDGINDPKPASATLTLKKGDAVTSSTLNVVAATPDDKHITIVHSDGTDTVDLIDAATTSLDTLAASLDSAHTGGKDWKYNIPRVDATFDKLPPYMLAAVGNRKPAATAASVVYPWFATMLPAPTPLQNDLFVATSVQAAFPGTSATGLSEIGTAASGVQNFGFTPTKTDPEDILTTDVTFYSTANASYNVDSRLISSIAAQPVSTFGLKLNRVQDTTPADYLSDVDTAPNRVPTYNLQGMKLENVDDTGTILGAGQTITINAYVYAQTGSWVVIPGDYFENKIRKTANGVYIDYDNGATPTTPDPDAGEFYDVTGDGLTPDDFVDLNRNGINDEGDVVARYARYNYAINFNGAIAENYTPLVSTVGTGTTAVTGAVTDWMDKWSNYTTAGGWKQITYTFDPTYVLGGLEADPTIDPYSAAYATGPQAGFYMPVANDILYQE